MAEGRKPYLSVPAPCENVSERTDLGKCRALPDAAVDKIREFRVIQRKIEKPERDDKRRIIATSG
jgi:hypothetical protein